MSDEKKSIQWAAQTALDIQTACNMGGVSRAFADAVQAVWGEAHKQGKGTDWVNEHPIVYLFLVQIAHLQGSNLMDSFTRYQEATKECERLAREVA